MKGFMIYETPLWGDEEKVVYVQEVKEASYTLKHNIPFGSDITCYLEGMPAEEPVTKAACNKDDTYDFETGALIALMKMCGREKVAEACCEAFPHETSGSNYRGNKQYRERIKELREKVDGLYAYNKRLIDEIDQKNHEIISLKALKISNEALKKDNESFRKTCEKLKEENERLKKEKEQIIVAKNILYNRLDKENKELHKNIDELFESEQHTKTELGRLYFEKHRLEEEVEKLKLDCEKLQHGYNDMLYKIPTKREEMWAEIFAIHKESDVIIKVKKEDIITFLHEIENRIPEITWNSCVKIFETKYTIGNIYEELKNRDTIYFRLSKETTLSYSSDQYIYPYRELKHIDYLPPMRWDLFEKGRIVVGVRKEHYDEFILNATEHIDNFNMHKPYNNFNYSFFMYDKDANFIEAIGRSQFRQIKEINNHKVVYWEDVR